jgi:phosphatidylinositol alpha-mannosyltransferase
MRIAMYHGTLPQPGRKPGGVEVFVHRLAEALITRGHDVDVLSYSQPPPGATYRVRRLPMRIAEDRQFLRLYVASWLLNLQRFADFDVAHFHGDDWFFLHRRLPVVRTFHGSALFEARSAASLRRRINQTMIFPLELLAGKLATSAYGVGIDSEIIYQTDGLLPLGIDLSDRRPQPSPNPSILFIGTWQGRKRGAFLHDIFRREVRSIVPNAELWMVSDACEQSDGVNWIHAPSDEELSELFSRSWIFCLPSSYEGFGIPYLEAMAHGIPVVASPNSGAKTLLGEGRYGVLAEDSDLGQRLVAILKDAVLRESMAREGKLRALEYSWERMAELHEAAYLKAIERWDARRK